MACKEVQALRLLVGSDNPVKALAVGRLVRKYATGRRSCVDVCQGLDALKAQHQPHHLHTLVVNCLEVVEPVPSCLWVWCCANAGLLPCSVLRHMLTIAAESPRYFRHLAAHLPGLLATPDGVVAALHELHRLPQIADAVDAAVAELRRGPGCRS